MTTAPQSWDRARTIADAVLYEGYLLYPYRASSAKNQSRWQFGVLGPPGAERAGIGEDDTLSAQFLMQQSRAVTLVVRFLHLQHRQVERRGPDGEYERVDELTTPSGSWLTWDEAVECEFSFGPLDFGESDSWCLPIAAAASTETESIDGGRLIRERHELRAELDVRATSAGTYDQVTLTVRNTGGAATDKQDAIARSAIGTHVIAHAVSEDAAGGFISLLDPPPEAEAAVAECTRHRCFPVLAGPADETDLLLISPIILYDHPEIAEQSEGALYDSTEIDEILTLRVMTMTDDEKAQARATDPRAAAIIDRCDGMSPEAMLNLHGVLRDPHTGAPDLIPEIPDGVDWWDPLADTAVAPGTDAVLVNGVRIAAGSRVRLRPGRRADAQDIFFAGRTAKVTAVHSDVDGNQHVAVVVEDDPAADLHEWYGRYLYFAPDEIDPLPPKLTIGRESASEDRQNVDLDGG